MLNCDASIIKPDQLLSLNIDKTFYMCSDLNLTIVNEICNNIITLEYFNNISNGSLMDTNIIRECHTFLPTTLVPTTTNQIIPTTTIPIEMGIVKSCSRTSTTNRSNYCVFNQITTFSENNFTLLMTLSYDSKVINFNIFIKEIK